MCIKGRRALLFLYIIYKKKKKSKHLSRMRLWITKTFFVDKTVEGKWTTSPLCG